MFQLGHYHKLIDLASGKSRLGKVSITNSYAPAYPSSHFYVEGSTLFLCGLLVKLLNESGKFLIVGVDHRFGKNNTTDHLYTVENDEGVFKVPEWAIDESSLGTLDELGCPRKKFNPDIRILDATIPEESESHNDNDDAVVAALNRTNELLEKILEHVSSQSKTTTKQG